ncbi:MAG: UDP-3-O-(3-hydroxymyristoyl)glucosamine N-acyltransferase [Alphaproteobacteria bacterium]
MPKLNFDPRPLRLADLGERLKAQIVGDGSYEVRGVQHPALAGPQDLALAMDDAAYRALSGTAAKAAVVGADRDLDLTRFKGGLRVANVRYALGQLLDLFNVPIARPTGVHPSAVVDPTAVVEAGAAVGPLSYVGPRARIGAGTLLLAQVTVGGDAVIGADCLIHPGVRIGDRVRIGARVIVQPNAVIGSDGFSYATPGAMSIDAVTGIGGANTVEVQNLEILRINSHGTVVIEDDVEIGACVAIDRATLGATVIKKNTKIDNLSQIAHNTTIGANCLIAGQVGVAGSTVIGDRVVLAGQVGVGDHLRIGDDAVVAAGSGVGTSIPARAVYGGYPAVPKETFIEEMMNLKRLKRLIKDVAELKAALAGKSDSGPAQR